MRSLRRPITDIKNASDFVGEVPNSGLIARQHFRSYPCSFGKSFARPRTQSMKTWAAGLSVRFFNVTISAGCHLPGIVTGKTFTASSWAQKCNNERGNTLM